MLRVVNLRSYGVVEGEVLVKVDRSSVLGNPFRMKDDSLQERERVCKEYKEYFDRKVKEPGAFRDEVIRIFRMVRDGQNVALGCWCHPKDCHADYIKSFLAKHLCPGKCSECPYLQEIGITYQDIGFVGLDSICKLGIDEWM